MTHGEVLDLIGACDRVELTLLPLFSGLTKARRITDVLVDPEVDDNIKVLCLVRLGVFSLSFCLNLSV